MIALLVERLVAAGAPSMTAALLKAEERWARPTLGAWTSTLRSATIRSWAASVGRTRLAPLLRLADAFWWAARQAGEPAPYKPTVAATYKRAIGIAYKDAIEIADLEIDGAISRSWACRDPRSGATFTKAFGRGYYQSREETRTMNYPSSEKTSMGASYLARPNTSPLQP